MKSTAFSLFVVTATLTLGGCAYWNEEAGAFLDQGDFGNAVVNNQLAHTCRKVTTANTAKYGTPIASNCPGRVQDGKYAMYAYEETVRSATERSSSVVSNADFSADQ